MGLSQHWFLTSGPPGMSLDELVYVCLSLWAQAALRVPTQRTWKSPAVTSLQGTHYRRSGGPEKYQLLLPMTISDFLL